MKVVSAVLIAIAFQNTSSAAKVSASQKNRFLGGLGLNGVTGMNAMSGMNGMGGLYGAGSMNGMSGVNAMNGMVGMNGLSGINPMVGMNGLSGINRTVGTNGIGATNGVYAAQPQVLATPVVAQPPPEVTEPVTVESTPEEGEQSEESEPSVDLNQASLEDELKQSLAIQKSALSTLNGQIANLAKEMQVEEKDKADEKQAGQDASDSNALHMTIKYPGLEQTTEKGNPASPNAEEKSEEGAEELKTPLIVISPKPLINFDKLLSNALAEASTKGSTANSISNLEEEVYANPAEKEKLLYDRLKKDEQQAAFYKADKDEVQYLLKDHGKGFMGKAKSRISDLLN